MSLKEEVESLNFQVADLHKDVQGGRVREAELLTFTEKMTSKNAQLQSESNSLQTQLDRMTTSSRELRNRLEATEQSLTEMVRSHQITLEYMVFLCTYKYFCYYLLIQKVPAALNNCFRLKNITTPKKSHQSHGRKEHTGQMIMNCMPLLGIN